MADLVVFLHIMVLMVVLVVELMVVVVHSHLQEELEINLQPHHHKVMMVEKELLPDMLVVEVEQVVLEQMDKLQELKEEKEAMD